MTSMQGARVFVAGGTGFIDSCIEITIARMQHALDNPRGQGTELNPPRLLELRAWGLALNSDQEKTNFPASPYRHLQLVNTCL
jgi:hypothetical protein